MDWVFCRAEGWSIGKIQTCYIIEGGYQLNCGGDDVNSFINTITAYGLCSEDFSCFWGVE